MSRTVYAIATMDTKSDELKFVADCIRGAPGVNGHGVNGHGVNGHGVNGHGVNVKTVDVGTQSPPSIQPDVTRDDVLAGRSISVDDRGLAVTTMGGALTKFLLGELSLGNVAGVIGIGGSGGTALITAAMRALPIGLPKVMVSTVASGNTAPYVDCSDVTMMYSVVDIAGLNVVSKRVLANAAHAIAGMVSNQVELGQSLPCLGMTMFGVTTPCVTRVREQLEQKHYDCLVFHATGTGGRAMEKLVGSGMIRGVLDITTTEVADEVVGGVFSCWTRSLRRDHRTPTAARAERWSDGHGELRRYRNSARSIQAPESSRAQRSGHSDADLGGRKPTLCEMDGRKAQSVDRTTGHHDPDARCINA